MLQDKGFTCFFSNRIWATLICSVLKTKLLKTFILIWGWQQMTDLLVVDMEMNYQFLKILMSRRIAGEGSGGCFLLVFWNHNMNNAMVFSFVAHCQVVKEIPSQYSMAPLFEGLYCMLCPNLEQAISCIHAQGIFLGTDTHTGNILLMCTSQCKSWCLLIRWSIKDPYTTIHYPQKINHPNLLKIKLVKASTGICALISTAGIIVAVSKWFNLLHSHISNKQMVLSWLHIATSSLWQQKVWIDAFGEQMSHILTGCLIYGTITNKNMHIT